MQILGYIVSEKQIKGIKGFVKLVNDISKADLTKPTLIIGFDLAKKIAGNISVLDRKINDNLFWTFKKTERRTDFENDLSSFYNNIINNIINNIKYYYINILNLKYNKIKKLYNIIYSGDKKYIYISNNMFYLLYNNVVMGISLTMLDYCSVNVKKRLRRLYNDGNAVICTNYSDCIKSIKGEIGNKEYVIPYFMSIQQV